MPVTIQQSTFDEGSKQNEMIEQIANQNDYIEIQNNINVQDNEEFIH